mmetsp:Transcript_49587/g.128655  ORF Transcript_49587/g.128655 Transcript_49587/m.128655 type:complete len:267 (+) Transcript_49587:1139-1939(+)
MAVCASCASLMAALFSAFAASRTAVASSIWFSSVATISSASLISSASSPTFALPSVIFASSVSIFSPLSVMEMFTSSSSLSHQTLCSSSSFCSAMRRNIIFCIISLTTLNGPSAAADTSSTRSANSWLRVLPAARRRRASASWRRGDACGGSCRKDSKGDGGGTGFVGCSVLTPVTSERISMALAIAACSPCCSSTRVAYSPAFSLQDSSVEARDFSSASRSSMHDFRVPFVSSRSDCTSPRMVSFSFLADVAVAMAFWRASSDNS